MLRLKKIMTLFFIVGSTKNLVAQERVWRVGIHMGTGHYQLYNKNDWTADPVQIYPVKSTPTNVTVGATTAYTWGKHFGLNSGLLLFKAKQEFGAAKDPDSPDPLEQLSITNTFSYLKLPLSFQFSTNNEATHQLVASLGVQTSFLLDYKEHFLQRSSSFYSEAVWHKKTSRDIDNPNNEDGKYSHFLFRRFLLGATSFFAYKLKMRNGWILDIGLKGDYDFTNAENRKAKNVATNNDFWVSGIKRYGYGDIATRPKTHNRSWGLFVGASIPVSIR